MPWECRGHLVGSFATSSRSRGFGLPSGKILRLRKAALSGAPQPRAHPQNPALMNREYHKAYSQELHRDMEALVFGHAGTPVLVFPTSMGKFFEYEDRGMIGALASKIDRGELQVFCPDGVDTESWYNKGVHPREGW